MAFQLAQHPHHYSADPFQHTVARVAMLVKQASNATTCGILFFQPQNSTPLMRSICTIPLAVQSTLIFHVCAIFRYRTIRLPREAVNAPFLEVSKDRLDEVLGSLI